MGLVYADITLVNDSDLERLHDGTITENQVRQIEVTALVDSGAYMLIINERIRRQLGLRKKKVETAELADGSLVDLDVVGTVEVRFKNRSTSCNAMVMPGENEVLLGAIPMEEMDVLIHPKLNSLIVNPNTPYQPIIKLK